MLAHRFSSFGGAAQVSRREDPVFTVTATAIHSHNNRAGMHKVITRAERHTVAHLPPSTIALAPCIAALQQCTPQLRTRLRGMPEGNVNKPWGIIGASIASQLGCSPQSHWPTSICVPYWPGQHSALTNLRKCLIQNCPTGATRLDEQPWKHLCVQSQAATCCCTASKGDPAQSLSASPPTVSLTP